MNFSFTVETKKRKGGFDIMGKSYVYAPDGYKSKLNIIDTQLGIKLVKDTFERKLAKTLNLIRVSAPLFVDSKSGLNDNLNGIERPVEFDLLEDGRMVEFVHSLAKWKRLALKNYGFSVGEGLYTDMNAIRRDETMDNTHSIYADQWDWEKVITPEQRTIGYLYQVADAILVAVKQTQLVLNGAFPEIGNGLPKHITYLTSQDLLDQYPDLDAKQREDAVCKKYGAVFISQIGKKLSSGSPHDGRAPDYDDWELNGDILIWHPVLERALEISSMGIRVDEKTLDKQLRESGHDERRSLPFHSMLLNGELPLTIGGGIGQSRLCMLLLEKVHLGEVQASIWPDYVVEECKEKGIVLL